ncbi:MAG: hypothetical protein EOM06_11480, partial [Sphingobacteriia bacterium]|nr:hypothetical protein [Sphingobacteriia bacterium]
MKTLKILSLSVFLLSSIVLSGQKSNVDDIGFEKQAKAMLENVRLEKLDEINNYLDKLDEMPDLELSEEQHRSLDQIRSRIGELGDEQKTTAVYFIFKTRRGRYYWMLMGLNFKIKYLGRKHNNPLNKGIDYSISSSAGVVPLIIVSNDYSETVKIDPGRTPIILLGTGAVIENTNSSAFQFENALLYSLVSGFYIRNCNSDIGGGARFLNSNAIFLLNYLRGNHASTMGGGIFAQNASGTTPFIVGNYLQNNHAPQGGGLAFDHDFTTIASLNLMRQNQATTGGGAYFNKSVTLFMFNLLYENHAVDGGALTIDQSYLTTIGVNSMLGNLADQRGGGIFVTGQDTIPSLICFNIIGGNQANNDGGGIFINKNTDAIVLLNIINENSAMMNGGGIAIDEANIYTTLLANQICDNIADNGGGLWLYNLQNTSGAIGVNRISHNIGYSAGGGICIIGDQTNTEITLRNKISHNNCPLGGGIYIDGINNPEISDNEIYLNDASLGGGILCQGGTVARIEGNEIFKNCAENKGGGVFVTGPNTNPIIYLANGFIKNVAKQGGAIFLDNLCNPTISGNDFLKNQAEEGGAIFGNTAAFKVMSNLFKWNQSVTHGGGIFINPGMSPEIKNNFFEYNIAGIGSFGGCGKNFVTKNKTGPANGGALFISGKDSDPLVSDNQFRKNTASNGGAISIENGSNPDILSNWFDRNFADWDSTGNGCGGAIHIKNASPVIDGDSIVWNIANFGGGIACMDSAKPQITRSSFRWNIADYNKEGKGTGGAIFVSGENTMPVIGLPEQANLFKENIAEQGGGIAAEMKASFGIKSNWFYSNHTDFNEDGTGDGGAVYAADAGTGLDIGGNAMDEEDNLFEYNTAGSPGFPGMANGGAIAAVRGAVLNILGNTFDNRNACTNSGAAVYLKGEGTYALIGGQNDDEIINTPTLSGNKKDSLWMEQFGNIIMNNNRSLKKQLQLPDIDWPEEPEADTVFYTYDTPPEYPDTTQVPHYEPVRDTYITTIRPDYLPPDKYLYVTDNAGGLKVINITSPAAPLITATFPSNDQSTDVSVSGNLIFVADGLGGLRVMDKSPMYAGMPPIELYSVVLAGVALVEVESDQSYVYTLGDDNNVYFGKITGIDVTLNGIYTPANPEELITGICAANNFLYLSYQFFSDAHFRATQVIPGDPPLMELYNPIAFPQASISDFDLDGFTAYLAMNQQLGEINEASVVLLEVFDPNFILITPFPLPPFPDQICHSVYHNGDNTYLSTNDGLIRYNQFSGMMELFPSSSLITDIHEELGITFLGNTAEGLQVCNTEFLEPVATIFFDPVFKEKEIHLYEWVNYPPEDFFMEMPSLPDTVIITGVGKESEKISKEVERLKHGFISQMNDFPPITNRVIDTLITINGGFLAVVDTARTRVLGNLIGGNNPSDANYATSYGGGIYVNNAGNLVNIGESETKTGDQK